MGKDKRNKKYKPEQIVNTEYKNESFIGKNVKNH